LYKNAETAISADPDIIITTIIRDSLGGTTLKIIKSNKRVQIFDVALIRIESVADVLASPRLFRDVLIPIMQPGIIKYKAFLQKCGLTVILVFASLLLYVFTKKFHISAHKAQKMN